MREKERQAKKNGIKWKGLYRIALKKFNSPTQIFV